MLEVTEPATVAEFQGWARAAVDDCRARGVTPVLVGGSALYTRAVLDRFDFPGTDPVVRAGLEALLESEGALAMHARLAEVDPLAATAIIPTNGRRVVRALEVVQITGRPFSASLPRQEYFYDDAVQVGVDIPRPVLDERIELRVRRMWDAGLVDEVRGLVEAGLREGRTAQRALGLPAGARLPRRRHQRGRGARADRDRHPALRPQAGRLVPQGRPDHLGGLGRPRARGARRRRRTPPRMIATTGPTGVG